MIEHTSITWLLLRAEYWSSRRHSFNTDTGKLYIQLPEQVNGIACIALAIGANGATWLDPPRFSGMPSAYFLG